MHTESYDDQWFPGESLVSTAFVERDGQTTVTSTQLYPSQEVRDGVLRFPMTRGVNEGYDRLAEVLGMARAEGESS